MKIRMSVGIEMIIVKPAKRALLEFDSKTAKHLP
jgi:hypothetical protein